MSESETESVEAVEVPAPKKKTRAPMTEERRKQMLENLAKGRKTRQTNLSNKRLEKEQKQVKTEQEHKCSYCGSQFKYKASKTKHEKTCKDNPNINNDDVIQEKPMEEPPKNDVVEKIENKIIEPPVMKEEKPKKKKKKVVYVSSSDDSSSDEEVVYKKRKSKKRVVYMQTPPPQPQPQRQPAQPVRPQITEAQRQMILKKRQEDMKYAQMGREQEANANRIKQLSANMLRKNRF